MPVPIPFGTGIFLTKLIIMKKLFLFSFFALVACSPRVVTYEQYGAVGDGVHDDFPAVVAAHEAANAKGLPVRADDAKTYLLRGEGCRCPDHRLHIYGA